MIFLLRPQLRKKQKEPPKISLVLQARDCRRGSEAKEVFEVSQRRKWGENEAFRHSLYWPELPTLSHQLAALAHLSEKIIHTVVEAASTILY